MAIKTFTTGEVLTAADTNTYLANSGLVYITSASFSGSSTVNINNVFTSTYDSYQIFVRAYGSASSYATWRLRVGGVDASTSSYFRYGYQTTYNTSLGAYNGGPETSWLPILNYTTAIGESCATNILINYPAVSTYRTTMSTTVNDSGGMGIYNISGGHAVLTAYDGFSIIPASGNITGAYTIYGYRKA